MSEEDYYIKAQKIVEIKKAFRINAWLFVCTMPIITIVNLWTSPEYLWFLWSLLGWGSTLLILYTIGYILPKYNVNESHEVEKEMERMRLRDRKYVRTDDFDERLDLRELRKDYDDQDFV